MVVTIPRGSEAKKSGSDGHTVYEVVNSISYNVQVGKGVDRALSLVAIAPQAFLQEEKHYDT